MSWLRSIGIKTNSEGIARARRRHGIVVERLRENRMQFIFRRPQIEQYVRAFSGVSLACWIEGRRHDEKRGLRRMFECKESGVGRALPCMLYAVVAPSRALRGTEQPVIDADGDPMVSDDHETAALWDTSTVFSKHRVLCYTETYLLGRPMRPRQRKRTKGATTLVAAEHDLGPVRIPASLLGVDSAGVTAAVFSHSHPYLEEIVRHISGAFPGSWWRAWTRPHEVYPVTLEPRNRAGMDRLVEIADADTEDGLTRDDE